MEDQTISIDEIYVPAKRRGELDPETVEALAESILEDGLQSPISVRRDGERYVLVSGLHRLEACKALGESTITAIVVGAPKH
jgi:ParB/RepB/Spo0J family partition protein